MSRLDLSRPTLVLSAGMRRSASTWLYNAMRLVMAARIDRREDFACGWVGDWDQLKTARCILVKLHDPHPGLIAHATLIVYSYRDIRDVLASLERKFDRPPSLELADRLVEEDRFWSNRAAHVMRYESMIADPLAELARLVQAVGLPDLEPEALNAELGGLRYDSGAAGDRRYHPTNLMHRDHVTDGRHGSWQGQLDPGLVTALEARHADWFRQRGYDLSDR